MWHQNWGEKVHIQGLFCHCLVLYAGAQRSADLHDDRTIGVYRTVRCASPLAVGEEHIANLAVAFRLSPTGPQSSTSRLSAQTASAESG